MSFTRESLEMITGLNGFYDRLGIGDGEWGAHLWWGVNSKVVLLPPARWRASAHNNSCFGLISRLRLLLPLIVLFGIFATFVVYATIYYYITRLLCVGYCGLICSSVLRLSRIYFSKRSHVGQLCRILASMVTFARNHSKTLRVLIEM